MSHCVFDRFIVGLSLLSLLLIGGCTTLTRQNAVPPALHGKEYIENMPGVRYQTYTTRGVDAMLKDIIKGMKDDGIITDEAVASYLSISGGGDNGAFGAGLLTGWSERGDRPQFDLVTGISTGALIAPFAFLGSEYDYVLKRVYTEIQPNDVYIQLGLVGALFGDAFADTTPLYKLISEYVDDKLLAKIAHEYNYRNRWLLIASSNLDTGTPIIWNMGKLASIGTPESLRLFRRILLASSAIPGAFPPVMIDVMAEGKHYQEMHVDGGATAEVFLYPPAVGAEALRRGVLSNYKHREAYIIRNSRMDSEWKQIERNTLSIMGRAVDQLIQAQSYGDLYRIYQTAKRDHVGFNLAYIGSDFDAPHVEEFDPPYMKALFQYARNLALAGYPWAHAPPGYEIPVDESVAKHVAKGRAAIKAYKLRKAAQS